MRFAVSLKQKRLPVSKGEKMRKDLLLIALFLAAAGSAYAYDDHDFSVWNTDVQEWKINGGSKIALEEEFRWGDNAREFYYQHYDVGIFYALNKYWNAGGGYRHARILAGNSWKTECEPYAVATLSRVFAGFAFDDRSRLEYRHFDYQPDAWRYRNKVTVKLPWEWTRLKLQPFVSEELFFRFGGTNQFGENRLSSGFGLNLTKDIKAEIYYLLDSVKNSKGQWVDANVLGTKLKIAF